MSFPPGGTQTDIYIFDYNKKDDLKYSDNGYANAINFSSSRGWILDISDLNAGTYYIKYISCNFGGDYKLILKDEAYK